MRYLVAVLAFFLISCKAPTEPETEQSVTTVAYAPEDFDVAGPFGRMSVDLDDVTAGDAVVVHMGSGDAWEPLPCTRNHRFDEAAGTTLTYTYRYSEGSVDLVVESSAEVLDTDLIGHGSLRIVVVR